MGDYRSKSYADGRNNNMYQIETYSYHHASSPHPNDLRSYYASYSATPPPPQLGPPPQLKKGKSSRSWSFNDPELQRKKRVATYTVYSVEGKVKGSFKRSFRWLRHKYSQVVYGWG